MYARLVERRVRRAYAHFNEGDAELAIGRFADGARLVCRGRGRLAADLRGKPEIAAWLRGLMRLGLRWRIHDVLVGGPPWNTRLVTCYTVAVPRAPGGGGSYRGVQYARIRWGRVYLDDIMPDTLAAASCLPALSASAPAPAPALAASAPAPPGPRPA